MIQLRKINVAFSEDITDRFDGISFAALIKIWNMFNGNCTDNI